MVFTEARYPQQPPDYSAEGQRVARDRLWAVAVLIGVLTGVGSAAFFFIEDAPPLDPVGKTLLAALLGSLATAVSASLLTRP